MGKENERCHQPVLLGVLLYKCISRVKTRIFFQVLLDVLEMLKGISARCFCAINLEHVIYFVILNFYDSAGDPLAKKYIAESKCSVSMMICIISCFSCCCLGHTMSVFCGDQISSYDVPFGVILKIARLFLMEYNQECTFVLNIAFVLRKT